MRRLKATVEYDGTDFHGWQFQPDARTVQGDLETALSRMLGEEVSVVGAGRTDAGAHALGQVAHFDIGSKLECDAILKGTNSQLSGDVRLLSVEEASPGFHARFSARCRSYRYRLIRHDSPLQRRYAWHPGCAWDDDVVGKVMRNLIGRFSFMSFSRARPGEDVYICKVSHASWEPGPEGATFNITADRFMHAMVRGLVGALIDLGRGYYTLDDFLRLLDVPSRVGAVQVAPPQGLVLVEVGY